MGAHVGHTAQKTKEKLKEAIDGVLFIDEAYTLAPRHAGDYGQEAIDEILQFMENNRERLVIIAAGYEDQMIAFINSNPGLKSRFNQHIKFEDFDPSELAAIFAGFCEEGHFTMSPDFKTRMLVACHEIYDSRDQRFGNARDIRKFFEGCQSRFLARISSGSDINPPLQAEDLEFTGKEKVEDLIQGDPEFIVHCPGCTIPILWSADLPEAIICPACQRLFASGWGLMKGSPAYESRYGVSNRPKALEDLVGELDRMVGLDAVKAQIKNLLDLVKMEKEKRRRGHPVGARATLHMVFTGNPGTGKTTIARLVGNIFKQMGLLSRGHFIEVDRSKLIGRYLGETEKNTAEKLDQAMDGILFVDEAYSLARNYLGSDYGQEAIDTILKRMEDARSRLVVIVAGYQEPMERFLQSNPGLASRFPTHVLFEDYTPDQMLQILDQMAATGRLSLEQPLRERAHQFFVERFSARDETFSNARLIRNLFDRLRMLQSSRLSKLGAGMSNEDLQNLTLEDWPLSSDLERVR